jgi:hypothetical protein
MLDHCWARMHPAFRRRVAWLGKASVYACPPLPTGCDAQVVSPCWTETMDLVPGPPVAAPPFLPAHECPVRYPGLGR